MMMLIKLAWRNLWRNARRSGLAMGTIVMGVAMIVIFAATMDGIFVKLVRRAVRTQTGHIQVHRAGFHEERKLEDFLTTPKKVEDTLKGMKNVEAYTLRSYAFGFLASYAKSETTAPVPFDKKPWTKGYTRQAIVPIKSAKELGIKTGDQVLVKVLPPGQKTMSTPHIGLVSYDVVGTSSGTLTLISQLDEHIPESGIAVLWKTRQESKPVGVMGVEPEREKTVSTLMNDVDKGAWLKETKPGEPPQILLGSTLAHMMNVEVNDFVIFPFMAEWVYGPADNRPVEERLAFQVAGIFTTGLPEVDRAMVITDIKEMSRRANLIAPNPEDRGEPLVHEIAILLDSVEAADRVKMDLTKRMPELKSPRLEQNNEAADQLRALAAQEANLIESGGGDDEDIMPTDRADTTWQAKDIKKVAVATTKGGPAAQITQEALKMEVLSWKELLPGIVQLLNLNKEFLAMLMMILYVIVGVGIMNTILMAVMERIREFGIMLGIGMRPKRLVGLILTEAFFMSVIGGILGVIIGGLVCLWGAKNGFDLSGIDGAAAAAAVMKLDPVITPHLTVEGLVIAPIVAVVVTVLAAVYPGYKAAAFDPIESIRHQ